MKRLVVVALAALTAAAPVTLDGYIGKYPFDPVEGVGFLAHPTVVERVRRAIPDRFVADHILKPQVSTPVEFANGVIFAQSCEKGACERQNWAVLVPRAAAGAWVCYHNDDLTGGDGRWFAGGKLVDKSGSRCPQTIRDVPERVFRLIGRTAAP